MGCEICKGINSNLCPVCGHVPEMIECPVCAGQGVVSWWAVDRRTGNEREVLKVTYACLPATEALAEQQGKWYYQGYTEKCETCDGTGEVEYERHPEDFYDEDAYMEARYERKNASL